MKITLPTLALLATCLLTAMSSPAEAATRAAKVVYAFGDVTAVRADGTPRALARGDYIAPGDTVKTGRGRTQLRFTDGGYAAMQPNTEYQIEDYHYEGKIDGKEKSFLNLVRGSVRLVTGFIGRSNKKNFRLRTSVATIGIRGTSGKVSHCESNCGARGPGTSLAGYGGIWDLNSGTYSGPVKAGQATFCNGADCFAIPGFGQRQPVAEESSELEETVDENTETVGSASTEPVLTEGVQSDDSGRQCAFGNCGEANILVALNQVGATASSEVNLGRATDTFDQVAVVFNNGVPIYGVDVDGGGDAPYSFVVTDPAALRQGLLDFPDPAVSALGLAILDALPLEQLQLLTLNPATVATEDFGLTSDGHLLHGRWQNGNLLHVAAGFNGRVLRSEVVTLTGFQSEHFLFGADPGVIPSTGLATYVFTGGTFSTAQDGSTIGQGVTAGTLLMDFAIGLGSIDMKVIHNMMTFDVLGGLQLKSDRGFFTDSSVFAFHAGNPYQTLIDGFFSTPGASGPLAAGLAYEIKTEIPILGVAGFGLVSTAASPPPPQLLIMINSGLSVAWAAPQQIQFVNDFGFDHLWLAQDGHALVDEAGVSLGGVSADDSGLPGLFNPLVSNVAGLSAALDQLPGFTRIADAQAILANVPTMYVDALNANPPAVDSGDNAVTPDGLLFYGRFTDGNLLAISGNLDNPAASIFELIAMNGFQSTHFIVGSSPTPVPFSGSGSYSFSGGTDSTAIDGSTLGNGVTSGILNFDFGLNLAALDMAVSHDGMNFNVSGPLFAFAPGSSEFFASQPFGLTAMSGMNAYTASAFGFFDTAGSPAPSAAGLTYTINTTSPFTGAAGFSNVGMVNPAPLAIGDYVAYAGGFVDGSGLNGRAVAFNDDGSANTAQTTTGVVTAFITNEQPSPCTPNCTFGAGGFGIRDATGAAGAASAPQYGVSWARFFPNNAVAHHQLGTPVGSSHVISSTMPTVVANVPMSGSGVFNILKGGSLPTVLMETGGVVQNEVVGSLNAASISIDFGTGAISSGFAGSFPDRGAGGGWSVTSSALSFNRLNQNHTMTGMGTVVSAQLTNPSAYKESCSGGCTLFFESQFSLVGPKANAAAGSILANTPSPSYPGFTMNGTYLLGR